MLNHAMDKKDDAEKIGENSFELDHAKSADPLAETSASARKFATEVMVPEA